MVVTEELKLLVVDDEEGMRLGMRRGLDRHEFQFPKFGLNISYDITLAEDGEQAIEILKENAFDLILLDYKLPGLNGLDVLQFVQADHPETTVIMVTAFASLEVAVSATKNGAYDFLPKPFSPRELRNIVSKATQHIITVREAHKLAEEKRRIRFEFLSVLAHELKSPLAAVENYLNLMDQRIAGEDMQAYDNSIKRSLARLGGMRKMILDLLDLTRIESGQFQGQSDWIDVRELVETSMEDMKALAEEMEVTLNADFQGDCNILAIHAELEILVNNFLSNAIKYNRKGGSVEILVNSDSETLTLSVKDTGIGMTKEESEQLFEEFVRIRNDKTRNIQGSGLGLSIVKKILRNLHGEVKIQSEPDVGSTFTVKLPVQVEQTEDKAKRQ